MTIERTKITERYAAYNADTVEVARSLPDDSVDYSVFSPPFASLFVYSALPEDMGNCRNYDEFFAHYAFLIREQFRVMAPGRLLSAHCMLLPTSKAHDGFIGLRDFRGDLIRAYVKEGFIWHSEVCIFKDPVTAMQRTKALGLLYKQLRKDSAMSRQGVADYLVTFRKPGVNAKPVTKTEDSFPVERWQRYASPIWVTRGEVDDEGFCLLSDEERHDDPDSGIDQSDTLNVRSAREHADDRHLCALQKGVIRRAIRLWSNPDDVVWSPFMGIGSEGYIALQEGRRFVGAELKPTYFAQAVKNLEIAAAPPAQTDMFALTAS